MQRTYLKSSQTIPHDREVNTGIKMTHPNMAPSMRDLLARHAMGISDNVNYQGNYTGDLPDLRGLEPHDLNSMLYENQQKVKELEELKNIQALELRKQKYEDKKG